MNDTDVLTDSEDERHVSNEILDGNLKTDVAHRFKYDQDLRNRRSNQVCYSNVKIIILANFPQKQIQNHQRIVQG